MTTTRHDDALTLDDLRLCFEGAVPAVIATASADGVPNVTYLSRVHLVDPERVALSNQFFSKTTRNLAENPRASVLLINPTTYEQFRLALRYERTERRGPVFERLRHDIEAIAAHSGMQDVFRLRAADVYRVLEIERVPAASGWEGPLEPVARHHLAAAAGTAKLAELGARLSRCPDLDTLVGAALDGLHELIGYEHSFLMLLDEEGHRLYTIASHGYDAEGIGSEVTVGEGDIGLAAQRCEPVRVGNLREMRKYSRGVARAYEEEGINPGRDIPVPGLALANSRIAVPAVVLGQLVGVLVVESPVMVAFDEADEALLGFVASIIASAIEIDWAQEQAAAARPAEPAPPAPPAPEPRAAETTVRFFPADGSVFLGPDYLIKGVAGRILWSLLGHYTRDGRTDFTNKEVRLDPSLELPEFRDNLESRLILLKRRLEERDAPVCIEKTGRGRFRLVVEGAVELECVGTAET